MRFSAAIGIVALSLVVLTPLSATRVACESGARLLASEQLSFNNHQLEALPAKLQELAAQTGAELLRFESYNPDTKESHQDYRLRDPENRYEVILKEKSESGWEVSAKRMCQSKTSEGWQALWAIVVPSLKT